MALPCPRCRTALPADARFCGACGSAVPAPADATRGATDGPGMDICAGCGVIAPYEGSTCAVCGAELAEARKRAAPRTDDAYWVGVRCQFQCRSCGHLSPLNHLDMDGNVVCLRCGLSQIFDVDSWGDGLRHAHAVGDLAGPSPEGRNPDPRHPIADVNPYAQIGRTRTSAELAQGGLRIADGMVHTRSLRVDASPGQPLCESCRRPLAVSLVSQTRAVAGCVPCSTNATYELPQRALQECPSLKAVIAEEQALDRRDAKIDGHGSGGAIAIKCPTCDAPLSVTGTSQIVTCEYCKASARIPSATLHQLGFAAPQPLVWWLLFIGRSSLRNELVQGLKKAEQPRPPLSLPRAEPSEPRRRRRPHPANPLIATLLPLAITAAIGWFAFGDHLRRWSASVTALAGRGDQTSWTRLQGCSCDDPPAQISIDVVETGSRHNPQFALSFRLAAGNGTFALPGARTSERRLGIGIACSKDRVVIAKQEELTAWSLTGGGELWSRELDAPYRYSGSRADSGISVYCSRMGIERGEVRVPVGKRGTAAFAVDDGAPR